MYTFVSNDVTTYSYLFPLSVCMWMWFYSRSGNFFYKYACLSPRQSLLIITYVRNLFFPSFVFRVICFEFSRVFFLKKKKMKNFFCVSIMLFTCSRRWEKRSCLVSVPCQIIYVKLNWSLFRLRGGWWNFFFLMEMEFWIDIK